MKVVRVWISLLVESIVAMLLIIGSIMCPECMFIFAGIWLVSAGVTIIINIWLRSLEVKEVRGGVIVNW